MRITGKDLIALGHTPGPWFGAAIEYANANGLQGAALAAYLNGIAPRVVLPPKQALHDAPKPFSLNIEAEDAVEQENVAAVRSTMQSLMRTPTVIGGAVMPDACPSGPKGTIPVGGVVAAHNAIHPGMHSADICCSVMLSDFGQADPKAVLDAVQSVTHFGPGGRAEGHRYTLPGKLAEAIDGNALLREPRTRAAADTHYGTQGDGNHFAFVGISKARGTTCLVTHHGSRGVGAGLYRQGMKLAEAHTRSACPAALKQNAWIPADSDEGRLYWDALQIVRDWTKANHTVLHDRTAAVAGLWLQDRFWNEHNFVFREGGVFYHAKGATPVHDAYLPDTNGLQLVPLNMAEPVLVIRAERTAGNLGFAPHGAGRNISRTAHKRTLSGRSDAEVFAEETAHIDARFWSRNIDVSELPSAYKPAATVRAQMHRFGLAEVVDEIAPYGSLMAGDWERDAPWRRKREAKRAAREGGKNAT